MLVDKALVESSISRAPQEVTRLAQPAPASALAPAPASALAPGPAKQFSIVDPHVKAQPPNLVTRLRNLTADGNAPSELDLERILGSNDLLDLNWFERGLLAARSVCRINLRQDGRVIGYGTGFLVAPNALLTNHHVLDTDDVAAQAIVEFGYELDVDGRPKASSRFTLDPATYFYTNKDLDFTLVAVGPADGTPGAQLADFGWLRLIPTTGKILEKEWMTIVQHPSGEPKQIAARENQLLKIADTTLWYATDTAPGSSGSPVFNDSWQLVALHHSGVPAKDAQGRWLGPDGNPAPPDPSEKQVKWIANEGIRVSEIVKAVQANAPAKKLRDDFLAAVNGQTVSATNAVAVASRSSSGVSAQPRSAIESLAGDGASTFSLIQRGGMVSLTMPSAALQSLQLGLTQAAATAAPSAPEEGAEEKFVLDPDYAGRTGYQVDFLSVKVALPRLTPEAAAKAVTLSGGGRELKDHHFSLLMSSERKLLFFSAENSDRDLLGKQGRKALGGGASDKWIYDERIDHKYQVGESFYTGSGFDRGHVVRREDNYWGATDDEAVFSNFDTFHFTNCTPQHPAYNRSSKHGLWGELENYLAEQSGAKKPKLTLFAGPVFSDSDIEKDGVLVPKQFWKVVVVDRDAGGIATFAFLLSQEKLVQDMEEDLVAGPFKTYQIPLAKLETMIDVRFDQALRGTDTFDGAQHGANEKMEVPYLEAVRFSQGTPAVVRAVG
jgi:endonuclease G